MTVPIPKPNCPSNDPRLAIGIDLFNAGKWYDAHDIFESLWHETLGPERRSLQGVLQAAVAQLHLESGNIRGATILYGESLGRLRTPGTPNLGLDMEALCSCVEKRLYALQTGNNPDVYPRLQLINKTVTLD